MSDIAECLACGEEVDLLGLPGPGMGRGLVSPEFLEEWHECPVPPLSEEEFDVRVRERLEPELQRLRKLAREARS
jgi:hypothetical protein